jgi:hypothetical protein
MKSQIAVRLLLAGLTASFSPTSTSSPVPKPVVRAMMMPYTPPPWYTDAQARNSVVSELVRDLAHVRFALPFPDSVPARSDCTIFRGGDYPNREAEYWVFSCRSVRANAFRTDFIYMLGEDTRPTLERVRYAFPAPAESRIEDWQRVRAVLLDTLSRQLGSLRWSDRGAVRVGIGRDETVEVELIAQNPPSAAPSENFKILSFPTTNDSVRGHYKGIIGGNKVGVTRPITSPTTKVTPESLVIECRSARLLAETAKPQPDEDDFPPDAPRPFGRPEVIHALRARSSPLAVVLESPRASREQVLTVDAELSKSTNTDDRELVVYAAHIWAVSFAESISGYYGAPPPPDAKALATEFNQRFSSQGAELTYDDHEGYWCYNGQFIRALVEHPNATRWAGHAFLERMREGWREPCVWHFAIGPDCFREVLARGEAALKENATSWMAPEIRLMMAEAHETAWSLFKSEYWDWARLALDAPTHRTRAIELYEAQLEGRPSDPRNAAIRRRLARLRIDVDTGYHRYYCEDVD